MTRKRLSKNLQYNRRVVPLLLSANPAPRSPRKCAETLSVFCPAVSALLALERASAVEFCFGASALSSEESAISLARASSPLLITPPSPSRPISRPRRCNLAANLLACRAAACLPKLRCSPIRRFAICSLAHRGNDTFQSNDWRSSPAARRASPPRANLSNILLPTPPGVAGPARSRGAWQHGPHQICATQQGPNFLSPESRRRSRRPCSPARIYISHACRSCCPLLPRARSTGTCAAAWAGKQAGEQHERVEK